MLMSPGKVLALFCSNFTSRLQVRASTMTAFLDHLWEALRYQWQ